MTSRSSRDKVRFQAISAFADLRRAENHLLQLAGLADDRSDYINDNLDVIVTALALVIESLDKFNEGL